MLAGMILAPHSGLIVFMLGLLAVVVLPRITGQPLGHLTEWGVFLTGMVGVMIVLLVSGQTYSVAEWALENYRISRQQTLALRASRAELERLLHARDQLNRQLEEARLSAEEAKRRRGQFLADMSHELRTPLNAILGFSESMLHFPQAYDDKPLPGPYRQDLEQIFTSGQQLLTVINDVLDMAKVDADKLDLFVRPTDLREVFEECLDSATALVRHKQIDLRLNVPDDLPQAMADPARVRQILWNLVGNAVKFTDAGHIEVGAKIHNKNIVVSVQDTGIGIDAAHHATIFEQFGQIDHMDRPYNPGAGLGLTISKRLVEMHKGTIWVESQLGKGSTFYFTLPCAA
jgi:signal transduction histidine kinase